jgi:hypothetical protein
MRVNSLACHDRFHSLFDVTLKMRGMVGKAGGQGYKSSTKYYADLAKASDLTGAFMALLEAAEIFDEVCGVVAAPFKMKGEVQNMKHLMGL